MDWNVVTNLGSTWSQPISNLEAKQLVAKKLSDRLAPNEIVGVGSGSTAFLAIQALANKATAEGFTFSAIPTSHEVGLACASLHIPTTSLAHKRPDWSFDGCDEVDREHNMIKGRGGAMFREKLLMSACPEIYILADTSKLVEKLGANFPIPIEVYPDAVTVVAEALHSKYPAARIGIRAAGGKDGPVITEAGNVIIDMHHDDITSALEAELKSITGVVETGLFCGFKFELLTA